MKIFTVAALALVTGLSISTSANAQQTVVRLGDETAIQMANRIAACRQPGIAGARYTDGGRMLRVRCVGGAAGVDGMAGGLGAGVAAGVVAIIRCRSTWFRWRLDNRYNGHDEYDWHKLRHFTSAWSDLSVFQS